MAWFLCRNAFHGFSLLPFPSILLLPAKLETFLAFFLWTVFSDILRSYALRVVHIFGDGILSDLFAIAMISQLEILVYSSGVCSVFRKRLHLLESFATFSCEPDPEFFFSTYANVYRDLARSWTSCEFTHPLGNSHFLCDDDFFAITYTLSSHKLAISTKIEVFLYANVYTFTFQIGDHFQVEK